MSDAYKIMTTVRSMVERQSGQVGRPMSLKWAVAVWFALLVIALAGAYDFWFGGLF